MKMLNMIGVITLEMTCDMGMSPVMFRFLLALSLAVVMENMNMTGDMGMSPVMINFLLWESCGCSRSRVRDK